MELEINELIEERLDELTGDRLATNEIIVEEVIESLGYNKRRDRGVKKLREGNLDWEIAIDQDNIIGIKVYAVSEEPTEEEEAVVKSEANTYNYSVLITFLGEKLRIERRAVDQENSAQAYTEIAVIDLTQELTEEQGILLEALSKEKFNLELLVKKEVPIEEIKRGIEELVERLSKEWGVEVTLEQIVGSIRGEEETEEEETDEETEALKEETEALKLEVESLREEKEALKMRVQELEEAGATNEEAETTNEEIEALKARVQELEEAEATNEETEALKEELESLREEKEALKARVQELEETGATNEEATNEEAEALKIELEELKKLREENGTLREEAEALKVRVQELEETTNEEAETTNEETEALKVELEELREEKEELIGQIKGLMEKLTNATEQLNETAESLSSTTESLDKANVTIEGLREEQKKLEEENGRLREEQSLSENTSELEEENKRLRAEIEEIKSLGSDAEAIDKLREKVDKFAEQIRTLTVDLGNARDEKNEAEARMKAMQAEIDNLAGAERKKAEELLSVIEDGDIPRGYVGVINTELYQSDKLHTFIGRCLQKLYELKEYEASQFIFNGDIFKLDGNSKYNDLMMNQKNYDIILASDNEIEELNKLKVVFSHFPDIIFLCKRVGVLVDEAIHREEIVERKNLIEVEADEYVGEEIDFGGEPVDPELVEWGREEENREEAARLLVCQLLGIESLVYSNEEISYTNIRFISTNQITYSITNKTSSLDMLLCKCIDAILAIEAYNGNSTLISQLKSKDFSDLDPEHIKLYTEECVGHPRINGTRYAIVDIDTVTDIAIILYKFCDSLNIDMSEIFLYFDAYTDSEYILDNYEFDEESIQLMETTIYNGEFKEEDIFSDCIIRGDMANNMVVTKNSLKAHKDVFKRVEAIKTQYLKKPVRNEEHLKEVIGTMLLEAGRTGREVNFDAVGVLVGTSTKLLSYNPADVGEDPYEIDVAGQIVYCARMEGWQAVHSLLKIHTTIFNNTAIAVKTGIDANALNFYLQNFVTSEPSLSLAITTFVDYVQSCCRGQKE